MPRAHRSAFWPGLPETPNEPGPKLPVTRTAWKPLQSLLPQLFKRHPLLNVWPGDMGVLSGRLRSATKRAQSPAAAAEVAPGATATRDSTRPRSTRVTVDCHTAKGRLACNRRGAAVASASLN